MIRNILYASIVLLLLITFGAYKLSKMDDTPVTPGSGELATTTIATGLDTPWEIAFLPNDDMLVTERAGTLRVIGKDAVEISVPGVVESGEGGLLGIAVHPNYRSNEFIYLYFTTTEGGETLNQVVRYVFDGKTLTDATTIVDDLPASGVHNGGRIAFGPDGFLYITTGDAGNETDAQDTTSLAGKILRVTDRGTIPYDNPFANEVYSYGHRNPQGLAWDDQGGLWATEHGRSGVLSGYDEINYIEKGGNYGWPIIQGDETSASMRAPIAHSGATTTWAPAGIIYRDGSLYFGGLRGGALYEVPITSGKLLGPVAAHMQGELGRIRAVATNDKGSIFISTSNRDGRGDPRPEDDRILQVSVD
jgi:glucose/arabinose dehydrogenase